MLRAVVDIGTRVFGLQGFHNPQQLLGRPIAIGVHAATDAGTVRFAEEFQGALVGHLQVAVRIAVVILLVQQVGREALNGTVQQQLEIADADPVIVHPLLERLIAGPHRSGAILDHGGKPGFQNQPHRIIFGLTGPDVSLQPRADHADQQPFFGNGRTAVKTGDLGDVPGRLVHVGLVPGKAQTALADHQIIERPGGSGKLAGCPAIGITANARQVQGLDATNLDGLAVQRDQVGTHVLHGNGNIRRDLVQKIPGDQRAVVEHQRIQPPGIEPFAVTAGAPMRIDQFTQACSQGSTGLDAGDHRTVRTVAVIAANELVSMQRSGNLRVHVGFDKTGIDHRIGKAVVDTVGKGFPLEGVFDQLPLSGSDNPSILYCDGVGKGNGIIQRDHFAGHKNYQFIAIGQTGLQGFGKKSSFFKT